MKNLTIVFFATMLVSCGNKKAEIVEMIKKTKNELIQAEMNHNMYYRAASKLLAYNISLADSKKYGGQQMKENAEMYKKSYEGAIRELQGVSPEILKDEKKLDSIALIYEMQTWDLQHRLDSLELELKKY